MIGFHVRIINRFFKNYCNLYFMLFKRLLHMYNSREKGTIHADEDLCAKMAERDKIFNEVTL